MSADLEQREKESRVMSALEEIHAIKEEPLVAMATFLLEAWLEAQE